MTEEQLLQAYNTATAEILEALDAAHVALVQLQSVKQEINRQAVELGMADPANPLQDGPGKNQAKRIEAVVVVPVENVANIHAQIKTARTLLLGTSPNLVALENAGLTVYDWQSEFTGVIPVER